MRDRWKTVKALALVFALGCLGLLCLYVIVSLEMRHMRREHYAFDGAIQPGMTEADVRAAFGAPREIWTYAQRGTLFDSFGVHGRFPDWHGRGRWPSAFHHAARHDTAFDWAEFVFYDQQGRIIAIVSGKT